MRLFSNTFFRNFASLSAVNVANNVFPLLTVPYVTRIIGPERYGLLNFSHALVGYFVLVINYGFDLSASKRIASVRHDPQKLNTVFSETLQIKFILFLLTTTLFLLVITYTPALRQERTLHCLTYLSTVGHVAYPTWFFQGIEKLSRTAIINLIIKFSFTVLVFILIQQPSDYLYQNLAVSIAHSLGGLIALYIALKQFNVHLHFVPWRNVVTELKEGFVTFYYTVTSTLYTTTNIIILQLTSSSTSVGYFTAGYRIEAILRTFIIVAFGQSIYPILTRLFEKNRTAALELVQAIIPIVSILTILIGILLFCLADVITNNLFGISFQQTSIILRIISLMPLFVSLNYVLGVLTLMNLNYKRQFVLITTAASAVGLLINYFLSLHYHQVGTAVAWVSTEGFILASLLIFLRNQNISISTGYQQMRLSYHILFRKILSKPISL